MLKHSPKAKEAKILKRLKKAAQPVLNTLEAIPDNEKRLLLGIHGMMERGDTMGDAIGMVHGWFTAHQKQQAHKTGKRGGRPKKKLPSDWRSTYNELLKKDPQWKENRKQFYVDVARTFCVSISTLKRALKKREKVKTPF